jgi:predicted transcriptional regulator
MKTACALNAISYANLTIGLDLKRMRDEAGLSQVQVSRKAKIRPEMLCRIESGRGNPTVATITKIMQAIERLSGKRLIWPHVSTVWRRAASAGSK